MSVYVSHQRTRQADSISLQKSSMNLISKTEISISLFPEPLLLTAYLLQAFILRIYQSGLRKVVLSRHKWHMNIK